MYFHYFVIKELEKDGALHLNKLESPSPNDALYQVWLNLASGSGEEGENVKSFFDNNNNDDNGHRTNFDQNSALEPSAQVS